MRKIVFLISFIILAMVSQGQQGLVGSSLRIVPIPAYNAYPGDSSVLFINRASGKVFRTHIAGGGGGSGWSLTGNSISAGIDVLGSTNNTSVRFITNNTQYVILDSNGKFGIGTTTPRTKLHLRVNDNISASDSMGLYLENAINADGTNQLQRAPSIIWRTNIQRTAGGGSSRQYRWKIDVGGTPASLTPNSTWGIALSTDSGGTYNTALTLEKDGKLKTYTSASRFGTLNDVGIGYYNGTIYYGSSPNVSTSGSDNSSFGANSFGINNTTGYSNSAFGLNSLVFNVDGHRNSAFGVNSLYKNIDGFYNSAFGVNSLQENTSGYSNTASGTNSLTANTTGFQNVAIGGGAMENSTTGVGNTATGYDAGLNNITGYFNVWNGWNAKTGSKGIANVAVGYNAGAGLGDTSSSNTFIGYAAGGGGSQEDTVYGSIAVGENSFTTKSYQAVLGSSSITETLLRGSNIYLQNTLFNDDGSRMRISQPVGNLEIYTPGQTTDVTFRNSNATDGIFFDPENRFIYATSNLGIVGGTQASSSLNIKSTSGIGTTDFIHFQVGNNGGTEAMRIINSGRIGIAEVAPTARLHIAAGTATANTAPLKLTTGTSNTTAEAGALEYTTPQLFFTNGGGQRQEIPQIQQSRVSTQFDATSNTTLGNITGLTATVVAGKIYRFEAKLFTTSNVAGGVKVSIAGTATATAIVYEGLTTDAGLTTQSRGTAMATTVGAVTSVTAAYVTITGTVTVNAAGTFTVQFAQNASSGSASSVLVGSTFVITEML